MFTTFLSIFCAVSLKANDMFKLLHLGDCACRDQVSVSCECSAEGATLGSGLTDGADPSVWQNYEYLDGKCSS